MNNLLRSCITTTEIVKLLLFRWLIDYGNTSQKDHGISEQILYINGLVQDGNIFSAIVVEILQFYMDIELDFR